MILRPGGALRYVRLLVGVAVGCGEASLHTIPTDPIVDPWPEPPPEPLRAPLRRPPEAAPNGWRLWGLADAAPWGGATANEFAPTLAAQPGGGFVLAYASGGQTVCAVWSTEIDARGNATGVATGRMWEPTCSPSVAVDAAGRTVFVGDTATRNAVNLERVDPITTIDRVFDVTFGPSAYGANRPAVIPASDGGVSVLWVRHTDHNVAGKAFDDLLVQRNVESPLGVIGEVTGALVAARAAPGFFALGVADVTVESGGVLQVRMVDERTLSVAWTALVAQEADGAIVGPSLAGTDLGTVLVGWTRDDGVSTEAEIAGLDAGGAEVVDPRTLAEDAHDLVLAQLVRGGVAAAWIEAGELRAVVVDAATGEPRTEPLSLGDVGPHARGLTAVAGAPNALGHVPLALAWEVDDAGQTVLWGRVAWLGDGMSP